MLIPKIKSKINIVKDNKGKNKMRNKVNAEQNVEGRHDMPAKRIKYYENAKDNDKRNGRQKRSSRDKANARAKRKMNEKL